MLFVFSKELMMKSSNVIYFNWFKICGLNAQINLVFLSFSSLTNIEFASFLRWYVAVELQDPAYAKCFYCTYGMLEENMIKVSWELTVEMALSLVRQTELTAQLCSIMRDVRNVRGGTQKKIEKLRHLLSGLLSELTYFVEPIRSPLALKMKLLKSNLVG
ncbi:putative phosphatidylinositol 3-kinase [Helianthus annuus]|nr:putative phosphatidylinositol 3-kinase [Helianthus annuus]KAJ0516657.1 putative phosphatidylinositol 3-kinase [Helianthus annuus]KAJ0684662.1 putative phosphatidylinositol 3-kinase [Helianthus annuus]KAJ0688607.1 putative phosphatidylinositol 3-kinase [Helianthus annuus]